MDQTIVVPAPLFASKILLAIHDENVFGRLHP